MKKLGKYITRITPNDNNWQKPSGCNGKCRGNLYENEAGFGWEEWLFNPRNRIQEKESIYQYGFLECFNKMNFNEENLYEEVYLYTRQCNTNSNIGNCHVLAIVKNLIKLSKKEAEFINQQFQNNGRFQAMRNECPNTEKFDLGPNSNGYRINMKFKQEDMEIINYNNSIRPIIYRFLMMKINDIKVNHQNLLNTLKEISKTKTIKP